MCSITRERLRLGVFTFVLSVALLGSDCIVRDRQQQEALWHVGNGTTKAEIVRPRRPARRHDEPPQLCKSSSAKEEIVYTFYDALPILSKRVPRESRYFCLNADGKVVDCCWWIQY